jgi:hypothetical protein
MPRQLKYSLNIDEIHQLNKDGYSLPEISTMFSVPRTTLNRYLRESGYAVFDNRFSQKLSVKRRHEENFSTKNFKHSYDWKNALIRVYGYRCQVCGYDKVVDAHHIIPVSMGGKSTLENGILLCPNCHAEEHIGLLDIKGLIKLGELLGPLEEGDQQPSRSSRKQIRQFKARVSKGSTTRGRAKAVMPPRAPNTTKTVKI